MNFCSQLPEPCQVVCLYQGLPHTLTLPSFLNRVTLVQSHPTDPYFYRYVQMDNAGSASVDVETWTLVNYLEEGGFPAL
jgi:hypothetical protein